MVIVPQGTATDSAMIGLLSSIILAAAVLGGLIRGDLFERIMVGVVGAGGFWFFASRTLGWAIAAKTAARDEPSASPEIAGNPSLEPVLAKLEATRIAMAAQIDRRMRLRLPLGLAAGILCWAFTQLDRDPGGLVDLAIFVTTGAATGYLWASYALSTRYTRLYKYEVLPRLAAGFGALTYRDAVAPDAGLLRRQRLFGDFDRLSAEDEIYGDYRGVPLSIIELRLTERDGKTTRTVFDGLLTRITLPRTLSGTTAVIADDGPLGAVRDMVHGARVRLEDSDFEKAYQVYGTDQIAARALLTPAFMQRFLGLGRRTGFLKPVALAEGNALTIALPKSGQGNLFEPPDYTRPAASRSALAKLHDDLAMVLGVADAVIDLDQSVRGRPGGATRA